MECPVCLGVEDPFLDGLPCEACNGTGEYERPEPTREQLLRLLRLGQDAGLIGRDDRPAEMVVTA